MQKIENVFYWVMAIIAVIIIAINAFYPKSYSPRGIILTTHNFYNISPTVPDNITVFTADQSPLSSNYRKLATINVQIYYPLLSTPDDDLRKITAIEYAKKLAASIGANVLVINVFAADPVNQAYILSASAIKQD